MTTQPQVQRGSLLHALAAELHTLETSDQIPPILNLHGVHGLGKSVALRQAATAFASRYAVCWLDCSATSGPIAHWAQVRLALRDIPGLAALPEQPTMPNGAPLPLRLAYQVTLAQVAERPLLLLLDGLDGFQGWRWLQEQLIIPLAARRRTLIVCASAAPLYWHFWELREACHLLPLAPFSAAETRQLLSFYDRELLADEVHRLSAGYPLALAELLRWLDQTTEVDQSDAIDLQALSPDERQVVTYAGILRYGDVNTMLEILGQFVPDWQQHPRGLQQLHDLLRKLRDKDYLEPHSRGRAPLAFRPAVHQAALAYLRAEHPADLAQLQGLLAHRFFELATAQATVDTALVLEWLYFSTLPEAAPQYLAWQPQFQKLLEALGLQIGDLVARLLADRPLLDQVRQLGWLESVKAELQLAIARADQAVQQSGVYSRSFGEPLWNPVSANLARWLRPELDQWRNKIFQPAADVPPVTRRVYDLLLTWLKDGDSELRIDQLQAWLDQAQHLPVDITVRDLEAGLLDLSRRGVLVYDPAQRTYTAGFGLSLYSGLS